MAKRRRDIIAVDIFCGAGGLTRGLLDSGINVLKGFDIDEKAKKTYEKNNKGSLFFTRDISKLTGNEVLENIERKGNYFLLAGCAPCQPFSAINKKIMRSDKRKVLLLEFARLVRETNPDIIIIENVPGLRFGKGKEVYNRFIQTLRELRYFFDEGVIDAKKYGVAQTRRRLVLLASKHGHISLPQPTHGKEKGLRKYRTVREIIGNCPSIKAGQKHDKIKNHVTLKLEAINLERMKYIKKNGGSRFDLPKRLQLKCHKNHNGHGDVYGRMKWDDVAPTLSCKCTSISNGRYAHPQQNRGISVREAAALQSFRNNYIFYGDITTCSRMVGNSVPPLLGKIMGSTVINHIRK